MIDVSINASVGDKGKNLEMDVRTITALINVYRRSLGQASITMSAKSSPSLEAAIGEFQKNHLKLASPDRRVDQAGRSFNALKTYYRGIFTVTAVTAPSFGVVTWASEGTEGGTFHSRCFSVPSATSGLTIGRGYDMKERTQHDISNDLTAIGLNQAQAGTIKKAAGLSGTTARQFVVENDMLDFQLTATQQLALFKVSYDEQANEVKRISALEKTEKDYGKVDWTRLDAKIKDVAIDLKFRGDYTPSSRKLVQKPIADNDLKAFKKELKDSAKWPNVPKDRFDRRVKFLDQ